ncbi:hypothetical protein [Aestuariivivens marinum]|uniref:hypothetical protein n=1 Tax=Aestuariivivens marinum TaxID=2913555 RepID=UPI001F566C9B|nr:hypothetical protein [Aestuariivivens marinum]
MVDKLYHYFLTNPEHQNDNSLKKRMFWHIYRVLKVGLFQYYKRYKIKTTTLNTKDDLIVSLTSFPGRIDSVHLTIKSIFNQSYLPNKIILWLGEEKFPNGLNDLPNSLLQLRNKGLKIEFCKDLGPHTKYYYVFLKYPNHKIVTVDDDLYYPKDMLKVLVDFSEKFPKAIIANRVRRMTFKENTVQPYRTWPISEPCEPHPSYNLFATGVSGVLYNPYWFSNGLYDSHVFLNISKNADDIWLKVNQVINHHKVVFTNYFFRPFIEISQSQKESLHKSNVFSGENDTILTNVLNHFKLNVKCFKD